MQLFEQDSVIWLNGHYVPWQDAKLHVLNYTFLYGVGVYEGVRAYQTSQGLKIFRLAEHTQRLFRSAHILGMQIPYTAEQLNQVQVELLARNGFGDTYLRPTVFFEGNGYVGLRTQNLSTHVAIIALKWKDYLNDKQYQQGIRVQTSSYTRYHTNSMLCKAKANAKYISAIMALQEAQQAGADDTILLDQQGFVSEGSGTNLFMVRDGVIYTPDTTTALEGITRATVFTLAEALGYTVKEKQITRDELYIADEVFFTGTAAQIVGIYCVDGRTIGIGKTGPITQQLMKEYQRCVLGQHPKYREWNTIVTQGELSYEH